MKRIKCKIGLEIHVQMNTNTKIFCSCPVGEAEPNTNVCEICMGYPGSKPRLNKKVLLNGLKVAKALNCRIPENIFFSRKSYFYPDMTKNFQITQYEIPLGKKGCLNIKWKNKNYNIRITRVHIEEDPAKLVHVGGDITSSEYTLIDYNRAGTPLIEIVTEPDFTHPNQVQNFLTELRAIVEHLGVYSSELIMKADANISVEGGVRVEVKNITGFNNIIKALRYEYSRQSIMAKQGRYVEKLQTRAFDEKSRITKTLRMKESEADYGYIFEPDLSWQSFTEKDLEKIYENMAELPSQRIKRFMKQYKLSREKSYSIIYAGKEFADFYEKCADYYKNYVKLSSWVLTHLLKCLNYNNFNIKDLRITPEDFTDFLKKMDDEKIGERLGKELIKRIVEEDKTAEELIKKKGLKLIKDEKKIKKIIKKVLSKEEEAVKEYTGGKEEVLNYLVGEVLKETKYQADVKIVSELLRRQLIQEQP